MSQAPPLNYGQAPQADLALDDRAHCPTCGRPWKGLAVKVCRKCGQPIGRKDRWRMVPASPGLVALEHVGECPGPR